MENNLFFSGLRFETKEVVDERLYIDGLTVESLSEKFGTNGRYARRNIFTFNTVDDKFYKLENGSEPLNPSSWKKLTDSFVVFPDYNDEDDYVRGSCVMFTDSFNRVGFYISLTQTQAGESPETHPSLWFQVSAPSGNNASGYRQTVMHRLNPADELTHTINIVFDRNSLPEGTSPVIECYVDLNDPQEGYVGWNRCVPSMVTWTTGSMIKIRVEFSGDMSIINYNEASTQQMNVKLVIV